MICFRLFHGHFVAGLIKREITSCNSKCGIDECGFFSFIKFHYGYNTATVADLSPNILYISISLIYLVPVVP